MFGKQPTINYHKQIQRREKFEDNERVTDQRKNENSLIPEENGVIKKTYRRVWFQEGFRGEI